MKYLIGALLLFLCTVQSYAQTTQASISGNVMDDANRPIDGAFVSIKNESTGFHTSLQTNMKGNYSLRELPLGGPYTLIVQYAGLREEKRTEIYLNQGDVVNLNFVLLANDSKLDSVVVSSTTLKSKIPDLGAATSIGVKAMKVLPINGRNFANLTDLSPLSNGGNISGQLASGTNYTIDGMNAKNPTSAGPTTSRSGAPYSISIEAVREFKVVTNQYDVTYGRSGGGTVSAVTKSGTNKLSGSAFVYGRANWLSSRYDIRGNVRHNDYSTYQYGFSLGGPIIKDKLHFFMAWDHQYDKRSLVIADVQTAADESRFNITRSTLDQIIDVARTKYGMGNSKQYGSFDKKRQSDAGFLRLDWQLSNKSLLTIRDNMTRDVNKLGLVDNTAINLYESTGNDYNIDNSLLATLRTTLNSKLTNELKFQHLYTWQNSSPGDELPNQNIPRAIIRNVSSTLTDGTTKNTDVQFGGHRFAQENFKNNVFQLVDNLYVNTEKVHYTFGVDLMYTRSKSKYGSEVNGRFEYAGLDNFINNKPYRYYREVPLLPDPSVLSHIYNAGIYGQMNIKLAKGVDFTGGVRVDYTHYPVTPRNELVYSELGMNTNNRLKSFVVQPRIQFTWDVNEKHTDYIKWGAGVFASDINNYMIINNLVFDGNHSATVDVYSPNVPTPNFVQYRKDPSSVPTLPQYQLPTINMTGKDAKIPIVYKGNISYTKYLSQRLRMGVTAFVTLGRNNYMYVDRNMVAQPFFRIANEANRGVYIPLDKMPTNGTTGDWLYGRISNKLGRVLELNSKGKVNQFAFVFDANYKYYKDGEITVSYTWNQAKDNTSFNGNVANSATLSLPVKDDPRDLSKMSYSNNQFRHKVVAYGTAPSVAEVVFGLRFSGIAGTRYSLLSGVNSNADFVDKTNDLAFVFDRNNANTDPNIAQGLTKIINNPDASKSIKTFIEKSAGKIAERNGGVNGFNGVFDLRAARYFKLGKTNGIDISVDVFNVANMLNKKWGVNKSVGNMALYSSKKFDKSTAEYVYNVNTSGIVTPSGDPYQLQIGLRYSF